jgi:Ca2+:H+ antiporter
VGRGDIVKGQITGSIIGNSLLGLGAAVLAGSIGRDHQTFNRDRAGLLSTLMVLSTIALLVPMLFDLTVRQQEPSRAAALDEELSLGLAIVLILVYAANLLYTLVTHRDVFAVDANDRDLRHPWGVGRALAVLGAATAGIALESHFVSGALDATAAAMGVSALFVGIIVLAVIGNGAEYLSAISFARAGRMGVAIGITVGSTIQVALLLAPVLVLASWWMGQPMTLVFTNPIEVAAVAAATFVVAAIARDGSTTWVEGLLLLAVYALFAVAFFLI